jgi:hypothetical protein
MKKLFTLFLVSFLLVGGCKTSNQEKVQKTKDGLANTRVEMAKNEGEKLQQVATLASGTDYSLKSVTNPPVQVKTAIDFNSRILSITGNPNIDELNKIKELTDLLNSEVEKEKQKGSKLLKERDDEILSLQIRQEEIQNVYEEQIKGLETQASQVAKKADALQVTVDEVNSWMGLGGVMYGLKRFVTIGVTGILIFLVAFIVLRFLAAANPIAGAIFSVFEHIASYAISLIKGIAPRSVDFSNLTSSLEFTRYKTTLDSVVDTIEVMKTIEKKTGVTYTLKDLGVELDKNLNDSDKRLIGELKLTNKYE